MKRRNGMKEGWGNGVLIGFNLSTGQMTWCMCRQKERAEPAFIFVKAFFCGKLKPIFMPICDMKHMAKVWFQMEVFKSGEMNYLNPSVFFSFTFTPSAENVQAEKRVRINEDPVLHIDDDSKSNRTARVPSFYIGKPLIDFDGGIASVSRTQLLTSKLTVTVRGGCTQKDIYNSLESFIDSMWRMFLNKVVSNENDFPLGHLH